MLLKLLIAFFGGASNILEAAYKPLMTAWIVLMVVSTAFTIGCFYVFYSTFFAG